MHMCIIKESITAREHFKWYFLAKVFAHIVKNFKFVTLFWRKISYSCCVKVIR